MHHSVRVSARLPYGLPEEDGFAPDFIPESTVPDNTVPWLLRAEAQAGTSERVAVIVLGMHRSGTSAMARLLSVLGCALPATLMPGRAGNEGGHWESEAICAFNDALLAHEGSHWADWRAVAAPGGEWLAQGARVLREEFGKAPLFVMKDPRQCRLLPFWLDVLGRERVAARVVITLRHPWEVAQSLARRDGLGEGQAHMLWLAHMLEAEAASRGQPRVVRRYDRLVEQGAEGLEAMARDLGEGLGVVWPCAPGEVAQEMARFIEPAGRHHLALEGAQGWAGRVFAILSAWAEWGEDPADHAELDAMRMAFAQAGPDLARLAEEKEALECALDAARDDAAREAAQAQETLMQARVELEGVRGGLAGALEWLAQEREEGARTQDLLAQREEALTELAELRDALIAERVMLIAQGEQAGRERAAALARLEESEGWVLRLARERHGLERQAAAQARRIAGLEHETGRERQRCGVLAADLARRNGELAEAGARLERDRAEAAAREAGWAARLAEEERRDTPDLAERDLADCYREIATLTAMLRDGEDLAQRREEEAGWMRDVWAVLARSPAWWGWVPARLRRRWQEGRLARRGLFDASAYRAAHGDVAHAGIDALTHYIAHGMGEGRAVEPAA